MFHKPALILLNNALDKYHLIIETVRLVTSHNESMPDLANRHLHVQGVTMRTVRIMRKIC